MRIAALAFGDERIGYATDAQECEASRGVYAVRSRDHEGFRYALWEAWLDEWIPAMGLREGDVLGIRLTGIQRRNANATRVRMGYQAVSQLLAHRHSLQLWEVTRTTLGLWATGDPRPNKHIVMDRANELYPDLLVADTQLAKALLVLAWARMQ